MPTEELQNDNFTLTVSLHYLIKTKNKTPCVEVSCHSILLLIRQNESVYCELFYKLLGNSVSSFLTKNLLHYSRFLNRIIILSTKLTIFH